MSDDFIDLADAAAEWVPQIPVVDRLVCSVAECPASVGAAEDDLCDLHADWARKEAQRDAVTAAVPRRYQQADADNLDAALRDRIEAGRRDGGLYLHGSAGTGKTYAVAAMVQHWGLPTRWLNVSDMLEEIRRSYDRKGEPPHTDLGTYPGLVVLDDLGAEKPSEWVRERLYSIINGRYERMLPTVITSNLTVDQLAKQVGARVASRICELCAIIELRGVDRRKGST